MFSRTLIKRYRLGAAGALTGGALAVFAAAAGYAQTDEIQVYDAEISSTDPLSPDPEVPAHPRAPGTLPPAGSTLAPSVL